MVSSVTTVNDRKGRSARREPESASSRPARQRGSMDVGSASLPDEEMVFAFDLS
jgi:hypothetical protein